MSLTDIPGLERVRQLAAAQRPMPPAIAALGITMTRADAGEVELVMISLAAHANPHETMHAGVLATFLDTAMGYATESIVSAGSAFTTIEFKINFTRPVALDGTAITAHGQVTNAGRQIVLAEATALRSDGALLASAVGTCMILPPRPVL